MIYVINIKDHGVLTKHENYYYIGRGNGYRNVLGNPYSHLPEDKCTADYRCKNREEAIEKYSTYFDVMYSGNIEFKKKVDEIYEKYKNGEDIILGCFCKPKPCHGDIIKSKLEQRLIKERLNDYRREHGN